MTEATRQEKPHQNPGHAAEEHHPGPMVYVKVAVFLAIVTAIEVAIYYIGPIRRSPAFVPVLLSLSAIKFAMVVLYFMHLRFDSRTFRRLFVTGMVLALSVYAIVLGSFVFSGKVVLIGAGIALVVGIFAKILRAE